VLEDEIYTIEVSNTAMVDADGSEVMTIYVIDVDDGERIEGVWSTALSGLDFFSSYSYSYGEEMASYDSTSRLLEDVYSFDGSYGEEILMLPSVGALNSFQAVYDASTHSFSRDLASPGIPVKVYKVFDSSIAAPESFTISIESVPNYSGGINIPILTTVRDTAANLPASTVAKMFAAEATAYYTPVINMFPLHVKPGRAREDHSLTVSVSNLLSEDRDYSEELRIMLVELISVDSPPLLSRVRVNDVSLDSASVKIVNGTLTIGAEEAIPLPSQSDHVGTLDLVMHELPQHMFNDHDEVLLDLSTVPHFAGSISLAIMYSITQRYGDGLSVKQARMVPFNAEYMPVVDDFSVAVASQTSPEGESFTVDVSHVHPTDPSESMDLSLNVVDGEELNLSVFANGTEIFPYSVFMFPRLDDYSYSFSYDDDEGTYSYSYGGEGGAMQRFDIPASTHNITVVPRSTFSGSIEVTVVGVVCGRTPTAGGVWQ
jgi:hypothetical protein